MRRYKLDDTQSLLNEPAITFQKKDAIERLLQFDGYEELKIGGDILDQITSLTGIPVLELSEILEISKPNYYRKRADVQLDGKTIDKLSSLLRIFQEGKEAFGSLNDFNRWLSQENLHLGNLAPKVFLKTELGRRRLHQAIGRIEHGIYA